MVTLLGLFLFLQNGEVKDWIKYNKCNEVQKYFIRQQVLDLKEANFFCQYDYKFFEDVRYMINRQQELYNAPKLESIGIFPDNYTLNQLLLFNCRYQGYLMRMRSLYPSQEKEFSRILKETKKRFDIYNRISDCYSPELNVLYKRQRLQGLMFIVGEKNYYQGNLPYYVPKEEFTEAKYAP